MRPASLLPSTLLAILPVLFLYAHNAAQLHPRQLIQPLVFVVGVAVVVTALLYLWLRSLPVAAVLAGAICFACQSFGVMRQGLAGTGISLGTARWLAASLLLVVLLAVSIAAARAARRSHAWKDLHRNTLWVAVVLTAVQIVRIGAVEWRAHAASDRRPQPAMLEDMPLVAGLPDIYFIMLDGYGRSDVLQDLYGFDNSEFIDMLRGHGFQVAERSQANYVGTLWALASILNMDYIQELLQVDTNLKHLNPLIRLVRNNRVVHELRGFGYEVVVLSSGYGVAEFGKPDVYLEMPQGRNDFELMLLDATPWSLWQGRHSDAHHLHRQRLRWMFKTLTDVPPSAKPRFVFAHVLAPHPPFVLDAAGAAVPGGGRFALNDGTDYFQLGHSQDDYLRGYAHQARWVTEQVRDTVEKLVREADTAPVVVLLSDHGPGSGLDWDSAENSNLWERYGILQALLLPGAQGLQLADDLSPVATFRLIFDLYFGAEMGPVVSRSYFCTKSRPFDFEDITDLLSNSP